MLKIIGKEILTIDNIGRKVTKNDELINYV